LQQQLEQPVFVRLCAIKPYANPQLIGEQAGLCRAQSLSHYRDHLLKSGGMRGFHFGTSFSLDAAFPDNVENLSHFQV
jgi:hypothetical protein